MRERPDPPRRQKRRTYTVVADPMTPDAWHLTVRELPETWTVAFSHDEVDARARERIALDLRCHPDDFDVRILRAMPPEP